MSVFGACLFGDCQPVRESPALGSILRDITATLSGAGAQWLVFVCASIYFLTLALLREGSAGAAWGRLQRLRLLMLWLAGLMVVAGVAYSLHYAQAAQSTHALTLLGGAVLGQGAGFWESRKQKAERGNGGSGTLVGVLIVLLAGAAVWQGETGHLFQYRGEARWSGPWDNPNTFGVLMAVGAVLAVGLLIQRLKAQGQGRPSAECGMRSAECGEHRTSNLEPRTSHLAPRTLEWGRWVKGGLLVAAAGVMGVGLVRSYSRGAWVGAAVGLGYLAYQTRISRICTEERGEARGGLWRVSLARNSIALGVVLLSLVVIGVWGFRRAEGMLARRAYSVANANDFSWRKRMAAYEGALQMLADKPWFGFGWNQPEMVYDRYYRAAKVDEGMAFQLNDYFTLGTTLGIPALVCFVAYVGLSLSPKSKVQSPKSAAVCRAGAVVLLVGFWFDGGLFKLATAATFWILLELGRVDLTTDAADFTDG